MDENDERLEHFLHEFQPRQPRALPVVAPAPGRARRIAAAAISALALAASIWLTVSRPPPQTVELARKPEESTVPLSIFQFTQLAINDPTRLGAALDEASRRTLPAFRDASSTLRVLAKE